MLAVQVKTITGTITAKGNGYLVVNGAQKVLIDKDTLVLVDGAIKTVTDLAVGAKVTVSGATQDTTDTVKAVVIKVVKTVDP